MAAALMEQGERERVFEGERWECGSGKGSGNGWATSGRVGVGGTLKCC
jgi:hypothetical protein